MNIPKVGGVPGIGHANLDNKRAYGWRRRSTMDNKRGYGWRGRSTMDNKPEYGWRGLLWKKQIFFRLFSSQFKLLVNSYLHKAFAY